MEKKGSLHFQKLKHCWYICYSYFYSTLRMVPSIFWGWQPRCLSFWWDLNYIVWYRIVCYFPEVLVFCFSFISASLTVSYSNILNVFNFLYSKRLFIWLFNFFCHWSYSASHYLINTFFSMPNYIPKSLLYMIAAYFRISNSFSFL